ncbi:AraC family transcriptional regulator [Kribbella sp. NBC_01505]|uniref:AraC family transcriptional regulator n=1 Tax=Kribbella sp. NBC_01505 TaxID=2903580 RepID=UPI00386A5D02
MDLLAELLTEVRSDGALLGQVAFGPPWRISVEARLPLTVIAVLRGEAWIIPGESAPRLVKAGEVAVVSNRSSYWISDSLDSEIEPVLTALPDGRILQDADLWPADRELDSPGRTALLLGRYQVRGRISERLLSAVPELLVVSGAERIGPVLALTSSEAERAEPGYQPMVDRLLDVLLLVCLREWFAQAEPDQPGWISAVGDPVIGPAMRLLHSDPARPWTVAGLAAVAAVSRATFARRFTELVGEPPMTYLMNWRLALAEDLLTRGDATVESIARQVGYGTAYSLSAAFQRERGLRPSSLRLRGS